MDIPKEINGFTHTEYLIVFVAMIFAYVGAEYFQGWGSMLRNRKRIKFYWQHLLWTIFAFTTFIQNWWGIWPRTEFITYSIYYFLFSLVPILIFYLVSVILFPSADDKSIDLKAFFYQNTKWFFALLTIYYLFTIVSSWVYPDIGDVFTQNLIRGFGVIMALLSAYFNQSKVLHIIMLIIGYGALIAFFIALP